MEWNEGNEKKPNDIEVGSREMKEEEIERYRRSIYTYIRRID